MSKKILIIDDEIDLCEEVTACLKEIGYNALYATSGAEGLELIAKESPALLLLDIRMPDMDGLEVMQEIVARFPHIVVVILTGVDDHSIAKQAIEKGAAEYVTKPVNFDELARLTASIIGQPKD